jgi:hypothetical protein
MKHIPGERTFRDEISRFARFAVRVSGLASGLALAVRPRLVGHAERLAGVGRHSHRTMSRLSAFAATGQARCTRGQASSSVGVWSVRTRANAVNENPPHGGSHCHAARCPFPLVARSLLTVWPTARAMKCYGQKTPWSPGRLGCHAGHVAAPVRISALDERPDGRGLDQLVLAEERHGLAGGLHGVAG